MFNYLCVKKYYYIYENECNSNWQKNEGVILPFYKCLMNAIK